MAEMSIEVKERGPEIAVQCVWLVSGAAFAYWLDFGFTRMTHQVSWVGLIPSTQLSTSQYAEHGPKRFPIAFQAAFALASGGAMLLLPDTPRWYYSKGREAEGDDVLARLHDRPLEDEIVQDMKGAIMASLQLESQDEHKFNLLDLLWDRSDLGVGRRIRISFLLLSMQQMMGE